MGNMLAKYLSSPNKRDEIVSELDTMMGGDVDVGNYVLLIVAATIYLGVDQPESALRVLHPSDHLECVALRLQAMLAMHRPDLAKKELKKVQEAYYIYQEMIDKLGSTALLLNGQAVTFLAQGKYAEAEAALAEAIEKDPNNPETLVNMIVLAHHQGKQPEVSNRYPSQLKDMDPHHSFVVKLGQKEADFDRMVKQYAI